MPISAVRSLLGNKLMVSARVIALAMQFMTRDAASQAVTGGPIPLIDRQREITLALSSCPSTLAEKAGVYVLEASGYVEVRKSQDLRSRVQSSNILFSTAFEEPSTH